MFGFFSSDKPVVTVIDKIWINTEAKYAACAKMIEINPTFQLVAWFESSQNELTKFIVQQGGDQKVLGTNNLGEILLNNQIPVFIEHYPLVETEQALFSHHHLQNVYVFSAMDESLFMHFGGERTISIMEKLGIQPFEEISHPLITKSISNAQKIIAKKIIVEKKANSQEEWFQLNLIS